MALGMLLVFDNYDPACNHEVLFHRPLTYEVIYLVISTVSVPLGLLMRPHLLDDRSRPLLMSSFLMGTAARLVSWKRMERFVDLKVMPGVSLRGILFARYVGHTLFLSPLSGDAPPRTRGRGVTPRGGGDEELRSRTEPPHWPFRGPLSTQPRHAAVSRSIRPQHVFGRVSPRRPVHLNLTVG